MCLIFLLLYLGTLLPVSGHSKLSPPTWRSRPIRSVMDTAVPRAANVEAGRAFMVRTGIGHRETRVACIMGAPKNPGGSNGYFGSGSLLYARICEQTGKILLNMC
jgi:hypothetical protein